MDPVSHQFTEVLGLILSFGSDFFGFVVAVALVAVFALFFGGDRLMPLIASLYTAIPLYTAFPYKETLGDNPYFSIGLYALLAALALMAFSELSSYIPSGSPGFLKTAILSILTAGLLVAVSIHVLPVEQVYTFSDPTKALFASETLFFWWLAAPLAGLFFLGRM